MNAYIVYNKVHKYLYLVTKYSTFSPYDAQRTERALM